MTGWDGTKEWDVMSIRIGQSIRCLFRAQVGSTKPFLAHDGGRYRSRLDHSSVRNERPLPARSLRFRPSARVPQFSGPYICLTIAARLQCLLSQGLPAHLVRPYAAPTKPSVLIPGMIAAPGRTLRTNGVRAFPNPHWASCLVPVVTGKHCRQAISTPIWTEIWAAIQPVSEGGVQHAPIDLAAALISPSARPFVR